LTGSSRIKTSVSSTPGGSPGAGRIITPGSSASAQGSSSRPHRTKGGLYVPPVPEILTGPAAVPGLTSAVISCTVNNAAYMRALYDGPGDPVTSDWTAETSLEPELTISPLTPEHTLYLYKVQCSYDKETSTEWTPEIAEFLYTLCSTSIPISGVQIGTGMMGELTYHCHTKNKCGYEAAWSAEYRITWDRLGGWRAVAQS